MLSGLNGSVRRKFVALQAKRNRLAGTFHQRIESLRLGMTTPQGGDGGDVIAIFISFNEDSEGSLVFHSSIPNRFYHSESRITPEKTKS
jgi:hypothetical protein